MHRLKIAGTDQVSFGPVPVLMVVKIIWSTGPIAVGDKAWLPVILSLEVLNTASSVCCIAL